MSVVPDFLNEIVREKVNLPAKSLRSEDSTSPLAFHAKYLRCLNTPEKEGRKVSPKLEGWLEKKNHPN